MDKVTDFEIARKAALQLGDAAIAIGLKSSKVFSLMMTDIDKALRSMLLQYLKTRPVLFGYMHTTCFRGKPGGFTTGILILLMCVNVMVTINSVHVPLWASPFYTFVTPFLPFFYDWQLVYDWMFLEIRSELLLYYGFVFCGFSLLFTVINWLGLGGKSLTKRGTSYLYLLINWGLGRYIKVSEYFVEFLECVLVISVGAALIYCDIDLVFGGFLIVTASSELFLLACDRTKQLEDEKMLSA